MSTILVIDDSADIRSMLRIALTSAGHEVVEAAHGLEGLQKFRAQRFDLVISDILMPQKEGFETIREMRAIDPHIPVIAMSGGLPGASFDPLPIAALLGANATLAKPFDVPKLLSTVSDILRSRTAIA